MQDNDVLEVTGARSLSEVLINAINKCIKIMEDKNEKEEY